MGKTVLIRNVEDLNTLRNEIYSNLNNSVTMIQDIINSTDALSFFKKVKFEKTVIDMLTGEPENFAEAIDQCQTYLVSIMAVEYLLQKHPNTAFTLNLGNVSGYDIISQDKRIIAECFASTNYSNNRKLDNDLKHLSQDKEALYKYEFFTDFKATEKVISNFQKKYPDISIIKFHDTQ